MTDETTNNTQSTDNVENNAGLPPGVKHEDTGEGNRGDGAPSAPVVSNEKPKEEVTDEDKTKDKENEADSSKDKSDDNSDSSDSDDQTEDEVEYISYGDENADAVVDILKEAKIPAKEAFDLFKEAADTGDMSKIDKSKLVEKLGKSKADLVMLGVEKYYTTVIEKANQTADAIYGEAGGEDNYTKVQKWARQKADSDKAFQKQVDNFNQMYDLSPAAAKMAARELVAMYNADPNNSSLTKTQVHGDKASTTGDSQGDYISRADYYKQMEEANMNNDKVAINNLRALRKQSIAQEQRR